MANETKVLAILNKIPVGWSFVTSARGVAAAILGADGLPCPTTFKVYTYVNHELYNVTIKTTEEAILAVLQGGFLGVEDLAALGPKLAALGAWLSNVDTVLYSEEDGELWAHLAWVGSRSATRRGTSSCTTGS